MLGVYKKVFKKEFIGPFIRACVLVLLLTAFFFEPLFEHKLFGNYMVYKKWVMSLGVWHKTLWGIEYILPLGIDDIYFYFSMVTLVLMGIVLIKKRAIFKDDKYKLVGIFTLISFIMSSRYSPWKFMPYSLFMIQFGWRLVTLVILGVSIMAVVALDNTRVSTEALCLACIMLSGLFSIHFASSDVVTKPYDYSNGLGWQREYMPVSLMDDDMAYYNERGHKVINLDTKSEAKVTYGNYPSIEFEITESGRYELPRIFYFGYELVDKDNKKISLKESEHGFVEASLDKGTYKLSFKKTLAYRICIYVSLITLIGIILYLVFRKVRR